MLIKMLKTFVMIASAIFCAKILYFTLLQHCKKTEEKEEKEIDEKMCTGELEDMTHINDQKRNPPRKPPRTFTLHVKQSVERSDNSKNSLQNTNLMNNVHFETLANDDYIREMCCLDKMRSKVYKVKRNQVRVQSERHSNDALLINNKPQEQIPSSEISTDLSKSAPQTELIKLLQLRTLVTNSSGSRNSQYSNEMIINETQFMDLPKMMCTEDLSKMMCTELGKNIIYPLTSTKIRSKKLIFHKLRKYLTERLHLIFNRIKNK